jgi:hypothetical protein
MLKPRMAGVRFQVEKVGSFLLGDLPRQSGLAALARPQEGAYGVFFERGGNRFQGLWTFNHDSILPCISECMFQKYNNISDTAKWFRERIRDS